MYSFFQPLVLPGNTLCHAIHLLSCQTNSSCLHWHSNKHLLYFTFSNSLTNNQANLRELYNHPIKVQVTTKDVKKEDRFCKKSSPPQRQSVQRVFFKFNPLFLVLTFHICQYQRPGSTWVKLNMTHYLKQTYRFIVFRLLENAFVKFLLPLHNAIISPPYVEQPPPPTHTHTSLPPIKSFL